MVLHYNPTQQMSVLRLDEALKALKPYVHGYVIEIKRDSPIRSNSHNRYYRVLLQLIAEETGIDQNTLHEIYKAKYNSEDVVIPDTGEIVRIVRSTRMESDKFSAYVAKVKQDAEENHGIKMDQSELNFQREREIQEMYDKVFNQW